MRKLKLLVAAGFMLAGLPYVAALAQTQRPEVRIGVVLAASGGAASIGLPERAGAALAQEKFEQADLPFTIKFISYDDASDPTKATNAVRRLINEDQVHFVVCCTTTPSSLAVVDTLQNATLPSVTLAVAVATIEPVDQRKYAFKASVTDRMVMQAMLDEVQRRQFTQVAGVFADDSFGESGLNLIKGLAPEVGVDLTTSERVARTDTNFTPQALRVRQSNPEVVYIHAYAPASVLMQDALRRVGYSGLIIQSQASSSTDFLALGGAGLEGTMVISTPVVLHNNLPTDTPDRVALDEFVNAFEARYGAGKADDLAAMGWDAVHVAVAAAIHAVDKGEDFSNVGPAREAIAAAMIDMKPLYTTLGPIDFTPEDHVGIDRTIALRIAVVRQGKFTLQEP